MATTVSTYARLITAIRLVLREASGSNWSDSELLSMLTRGTADLWRAILDLHQEHFLTIDTTNVSLAANSSTLTGVPADVFRVYNIELRTPTDDDDLVFQHRDWNHPDFVSARTEDAVDPSGQQIIYFTVTGAGGPLSAPTIRIAPQITSAKNLSLAYIPELDLNALTTSSNIPIPGEADNALIAWGIAYALAKERDEWQPDATWLAIYSTEKKSLLAALTPRQEMDETYADGMFEGWE